MHDVQLRLCRDHGLLGLGTNTSLLLGQRERFDSKEWTKCHGLGLLVC